MKVYKLAVFYKAVPAVFVEAVQPDSLHSVQIKPLAGRFIRAERTSCDHRHLISAGDPFIDDGRCARCFFV